jgi:hypothetical protein
VKFGNPVVIYSEIGPVAQWLEQGTHNSKRGFFIVLHRFAKRPRKLINRRFAGGEVCEALQRFAANSSASVENQCEKYPEMSEEAQPLGDSFAFHQRGIDQLK